MIQNVDLYTKFFQMQISKTNSRHLKIQTLARQVRQSIHLYTHTARSSQIQCSQLINRSNPLDQQQYRVNKNSPFKNSPPPGTIPFRSHNKISCKNTYRNGSIKKGLIRTKLSQSSRYQLVNQNTGLKIRRKYNEKNSFSGQYEVNELNSFFTTPFTKCQSWKHNVSQDNKEIDKNTRFKIKKINNQVNRYVDKQDLHANLQLANKQDCAKMNFCVQKKEKIIDEKWDIQQLKGWDNLSSEQPLSNLDDQQQDAIPERQTLVSINNLPFSSNGSSHEQTSEQINDQQSRSESTNMGNEQSVLSLNLIPPSISTQPNKPISIVGLELSNKRLTSFEYCSFKMISQQKELQSRKMTQKNINGDNVSVERSINVNQDRVWSQEGEISNNFKQTQQQFRQKNDEIIKYQENIDEKIDSAYQQLAEKEELFSCEDKVTIYKNNYHQAKPSLFAFNAKRYQNKESSAVQNLYSCYQPQKNQQFDNQLMEMDEDEIEESILSLHTLQSHFDSKQQIISADIKNKLCLRDITLFMSQTGCSMDIETINKLRCSRLASKASKINKNSKCSLMCSHQKQQPKNKQKHSFALQQTPLVSIQITQTNNNMENSDCFNQNMTNNDHNLSIENHSSFLTNKSAAFASQMNESQWLASFISSNIGVIQSAIINTICQQ